MISLVVNKCRVYSRLTLLSGPLDVFNVTIIPQDTKTVVNLLFSAATAQRHVCFFCDADTERAVGLLRRYQADLTSPEEQTLKNSVGKVSAILGSQLFQALLGMKSYLKLLKR